eukprot:s510_g19.t1
MRDVYWKHIAEAQKRWTEHPERVAHMKNLTKSELSKRRLIPSTRKKAAAAAPAATGASEESKKDSQAVSKKSKKTQSKESVAEVAECNRECEDPKGPAPSASAESS